MKKTLDSTNIESNQSPMTDPVLVQSYQGHKDLITSLDFHPNMKQIVSGSLDNSLYVWGLKPKSKAYRFMGHKAPIYDVEFSPNGQLIASASKDETVKIWNNTIEGNSVSIKAHNAAVRSVNFSSDGQLLLTSSDDKTLKTWNVSDKKFLYSFLGHSNWVRTSEFSPDNRLIASGSDDKTVKIWDTENKKNLQSFTDHTGIIYDVKFHPDGTCVASASHDKKIKIFDVRSKRLLQHYDAHNDNVNQISFHPSGTFLISASSDAKVKIWDLRYGKLAYTLFGHEGASSACAFSYYGDYFATGGSDSLVMLWKSNFLDSQKESFENLNFIMSSKTGENFMKSTNKRSKFPAPEKRETLIKKSKLEQSPKYEQEQPAARTYIEKGEHFENEYGDENVNSENLPKTLLTLKNENSIPMDITKTLENIVTQLDVINKTLQVFELRVSNNEEQISILNGLLRKEGERIPSLHENLYNIEIKKQEEFIERPPVSIEENKIPKFFRAPNN